jgi:hypothetical protein
MSVFAFWHTHWHPAAIAVMNLTGTFTCVSGACLCIGAAAACWQVGIRLKSNVVGGVCLNHQVAYLWASVPRVISLMKAAVHTAAECRVIRLLSGSNQGHVRNCH